MALTRPRAAQIYDIDYKQATRVVTVANITLSGGAPSQVDGVNLSLKDRVLVTGQSTASQNGIYYVTTLGSGSNGTWSRSLDTDATGEILSGTIVMVTEGLIYADTQWKLTTNDPITVGVTDQTWVQNYSANSIASGNSNVVVLTNANVLLSSAGTANVVDVFGTGIKITGTESVTGNITGGNILTAGQVSATGNLYGNYLNANIYYATGFSASKIFSGNSEVNVVASGGNINVSVGGTTNVALFTTTGEYVTGVVSASGNITGGNVLTAGLVSSTGTITSAANITGGNLLTGGLISATGAAYTGNIYTSGGISITGNTITASGATIVIDPNGASGVDGNVIIAGNLSVQGNVTYIDSNVITTNEKSITLANNQNTGAAVDGAGIDIGNNTLAYWRYNNATTSWQSNIGITPAANGTLNLGGTSNFWNVIYGTTSTTTGNVVAGNITTAGLVTATGNVTSGNLLTGGLVSATANITGGNVLTAGLISATGNIIGGNISTAGNVTANYFLGNVACASGIFATKIFNGNSEANIGTANGNANISIGGTTNVVVVTSSGILVTGISSTSGNVTGGNVLTAGVVSATGNATASNVLTAGVVSATANITGGNILTAGLISATSTITSAANVIGGNISTAGLVTATGNVTGGNVLTAGIMSSTGNAIHGNILTAGLISATSTITSAANVIGGNLTTAGLVTATGNITGGNVLTAGIMSSTGNAIHGNILTAGLISATSTITSAANVIGGNLTTAGLVTATGNVTGGNVLTAGVMSSTGNAIHGNILTAGVMSSTGNATHGNILTGGVVSATANITGGNILTAGAVSATGNVTGSYLKGNASQVTGINSFNQIFVTGATTVNASGLTSNVTFAAGANIALTSDGNTITIAYTSSATGSIFATGGDMGLISQAVTASEDLGNLTSIASTSYDLGGLFVTDTFNQIDMTGFTSNINTGNLNATGLVSAAGNIYGGNLILTGAITDSAQIDIQTSANNANIVLTPNGSGNVNTGANLSVTGNVQTGNLRTAGLVTATGNITGGNILTAGIMSSTGNAIHGNLLIAADAYIGNATGIPTATLHLAAGAAAANGAPLKFTAGTNLTTAEAGAMEYNGNALYFSTAAGNRGVIPTPYFYRTGANLTLSNVTTGQSWLGVGVTLQANTTYQFTGQFYITTTNTTSHVEQIGFGGTATLANIFYQVARANAVLGLPNATTSSATQYFIANTLANTTAAIAAAANSVYILSGTVSTTAAGTFIPQWAANSAAIGNTTTVVSGAYFSISPVASGNGTISIGTWA